MPGAILKVELDNDEFYYTGYFRRYEKMNALKKDDILRCVKTLAKSQGFYSALYKNLTNKPELLDYLEKQEFADYIDLILFLEC